MEVFISFSILDSEFAVSEPNQAVISYLIKLSSTELQKNTHNQSSLQTAWVYKHSGVFELIFHI